MATLRTAHRIWMYHLNPVRSESFTAAELWEMIDEDPELGEWYVTANFKIAQVGDPVIIRVNDGYKGDVTGLVAFGHLSDVNVEAGTVRIRADKALTRKLMKKPVSLEELRTVIVPKRQNNLADVTSYRAQISRWLAEADDRKPSGDSFFAEIAQCVAEEMGIEGIPMVRTHLSYERDPRNRDRVLAKHARPYKCAVCDFSFDAYGEEYGEFIHVHHLKPLSGKSKPGRPRVQDFALLCANCHAAVHWKRGKKPLSPEQLRKQLARQTAARSSKSPKASRKKMARPNS